MFFVYLLKCWNYKSGFNSEKPRYGNRFYCGHSKDINERLKQHRKGNNPIFRYII